MCSTDWGLRGHSCPITPWFINLLEPACMEILLLLSCVGCYLQPARQAVCISGCASLGCVLCNEMAHLVMYLAFSPVAEACFCIFLAFFLSTRIYLLTWGMKGWLVIPVDVCFINLHHCHSITEDKVIFFISPSHACWSSFHCIYHVSHIFCLSLC